MTEPGKSLLEKSCNKSQKSTLFTDYGVAKHYQSMYGGVINCITQCKQVIRTYFDPLDEGIEDIEPEVSLSYEETGEQLFVLNITASAGLTNGFRYIKELLLQHHNFHMNRCNEALLLEGVQTYTVKTDAFTIHKDHLEKAREILDFGG